MSALDAVLAYIRQGFAVVPIPYRSKGPVLDEWQKLRITAEDAPNYFNGAPQNVGVILGSASGLTDIDLDCLEAIAAAPYFLPRPAHSATPLSLPPIGSIKPSFLRSKIGRQSN
jgi:hypothetical protein